MDVGFVFGLLVGPVVIALTAYLAVAAAAGRVPRNRAIGIRLRSTMVSDAAWRAGHRAAVLPAVTALVVLLALDVLALVLRGIGVAAPVLTMGLVAVLLLAVVFIADAAGRSARSAT